MRARPTVRVLALKCGSGVSHARERVSTVCQRSEPLVYTTSQRTRHLHSPSRPGSAYISRSGDVSFGWAVQVDPGLSPD
jgi:hypothetical protein